MKNSITSTITLLHEARTILNPYLLLTQSIYLYRSKGALQCGLERGVREQNDRRRAHARQHRASQHRGEVRRGGRARPVRSRRPAKASRD